MLVEPIYRLVFGRPLPDKLPVPDVCCLEQGPADHPHGACSGAGEVHQAVDDRCTGLVLVADGIGGFDLCGTALRYVLASEGLFHAFHLVRWGHGFGRWFADLTDVSNRDQNAARIAHAVRRFRAVRPGVPVFLVAKSGGSGVMVKALEQLNEGTIERAVFLSPALSPDYDLSTALQAVKRELVVFWSPLDIFILGAGTYVFGTSDRVRTVSAGMLGFRIPDSTVASEGRDLSPYSKLRQIRWNLRMAKTGYLGGHFGPDSPVFLKTYVVPLMRPGPAAGD
jgi:hypothetical protein